MATLKGTKPSREHQSVWSQQEMQRMRDDITILYDIVHQLADGLGYKLDIRISPSAKPHQEGSHVVGCIPINNRPGE